GVVDADEHLERALAAFAVHVAGGIAVLAANHRRRQAEARGRRCHRQPLDRAAAARGADCRNAAAGLRVAARAAVTEGAAAWNTRAGIDRVAEPVAVGVGLRGVRASAARVARVRRARVAVGAVAGRVHAGRRGGVARVVGARVAVVAGNVAGLAAGAPRPVDGVAAGRFRAAVDQIHQTVAVAVVDGVADPVVVAIGGRAMRAPRRRVAPVDGTRVAVGAGERGVDAARGGGVAAVGGARVPVVARGVPGVGARAAVGADDRAGRRRGTAIGRVGDAVVVGVRGGGGRIERGDAGHVVGVY